MSQEIKVPALPESVADGLLLDWNKSAGDSVSRDEVLVEIETDKVVLEVPSPGDGTLAEIRVEAGETVESGQVLAVLEEGGGGSTGDDSQGGSENDSAESGDSGDGVADDGGDSGGLSAEADGPADDDGEDPRMGPAVRKLVEEHGLDASAIRATGPGGRLTKEDLLAFIGSQVSPKDDGESTEQGQAEEKSAPAKPAKSDTSSPAPARASTPGTREEEREPMSRLRQTIASRLVEAQQTAAMLTTFNEVNMKPVMDMRSRYKDAFEEHHGARLGFMSFFVKAAVAALRKYPLINAYIDGTDIVRHHYQDIGIAVSSPRGLVVPVLRNCEDMSFADVESKIREFGGQAKAGKLGLDDLTGGTFTITNGGVFGSLVSTPIINPPQSAILGMHKIQDRPMAVDGEVVILPMMYLALSYDHRIVDGKEAVQFLVTIKDMIEDPARLLLEV